MHVIWQDGHFAWAFVLTIVYIATLLLAADVAWRLTAFGGRQLLGFVSIAAILGAWAIWALLG